MKTLAKTKLQITKDIDLLNCSKNSSFSVDLDSDTDSIAKLCKENNILPISRTEQLELSLKKERNNLLEERTVNCALFYTFKLIASLLSLIINYVLDKYPEE